MDTCALCPLLPFLQTENRHLVLVSLKQYNNENGLITRPTSPSVFAVSVGQTTPVLVYCGVIPTVCHVLYREPFVETLQAMGCMLLYNIGCSAPFRLDIVVSGAAELAVNAIRRMARNEKVVMAAVKLLAVLSHESMLPGYSIV